MMVDEEKEEEPKRVEQTEKVEGEKDAEKEGEKEAGLQLKMLDRFSELYGGEEFWMTLDPTEDEFEEYPFADFRPRLISVRSLSLSVTPPPSERSSATWSDEDRTGFSEGSHEEHAPSEGEVGPSDCSTAGEAQPSEGSSAGEGQHSEGSSERHERSIEGSPPASSSTSSHKSSVGLFPRNPGLGAADGHTHTHTHTVPIHYQVLAECLHGS